MHDLQLASRVALSLAALVSVGLVGCADEDTVRVNEPSHPAPPPTVVEAPAINAPPPAPQALAGAGMVIHSGANPGLCLDAEGDRAQKHTPVRLFDCHGRENQRWVLGQSGNGAATITGLGGLCLDIHGGRSTAGATAQLYPCHGGGNQQFGLERDGHLRELSTGMCLAGVAPASGAPIVVAPCDARDPGQIWSVVDR
jgi:hypothetical protein